MTIKEISERKDDLLFSASDIEELARNVRERAIDKFSERLKDNFITDYSIFDSDDIEIIIDTINEIAEQMKGSGSR